MEIIKVEAQTTGGSTEWFADCTDKISVIGVIFGFFYFNRIKTSFFVFAIRISSIALSRVS